MFWIILDVLGPIILIVFGLSSAWRYLRIMATSIARIKEIDRGE